MSSETRLWTEPLGVFGTWRVVGEGVLLASGEHTPNVVYAEELATEGEANAWIAGYHAAEEEWRNVPELEP